MRKNHPFFSIKLLLNLPKVGVIFPSLSYFVVVYWTPYTNVPIVDGLVIALCPWELKKDSVMEGDFVALSAGWVMVAT